MSCTETHFGKFKVLAKGKENINKYIRDNKIEVDYDDSDLLHPSDYDKYDVTCPYDKSLEPCLIEFIEHEEFNDGDDFEKFKLNQDGTISFAVQFYNGGCCLAEALGNFEEKINCPYLVRSFDDTYSCVWSIRGPQCEKCCIKYPRKQ